MKKKILIDGRLLSNHPTGISRYSEQLIKAFRKKYGDENVSVIINPGYSGPDGWNCIYTKFKPYNPIHFIFFTHFINKLGYSIYYSPFYSGIYLRNRDGGKQVITVHDLMYLRIKRYFSGSLLENCISKFVFNLLVKFTLKASNLVISVSENTRKDLKEFFKVDSVVIGEGVNDLRETGERRREKGERENRREGPNDYTTTRLHESLENGYFLYVGNFRKQKNVDFFIEAFLKSDTPYWLVLAGGDKRRGEGEKGKSEKRTSQGDDEITSRFREGKITRESENLRMENSNRIVFTGALEDHEINYLYKNCVAFVLPSLYEGFGLPVLEAYCAGARVFSSNSGALKEFDHLNIHYFSPDNIDELVTLLERADHLSKPAEGEINRAREIYCWEKQMAKLLDRIEELEN